MYQINPQNIITDKTKDNLVRVTKETWPYLIEYRISASQVYNHIDHSYIPYLKGGEMTNWTHRLELRDLHAKYRAGEISPEDLGREVAKRLRALVTSNNPPIPSQYIVEAEDIAIDFERAIGDIDDYDQVLNDLYDWADTPLPCSLYTSFSAQPKLCWVNTF